MQKSAADIFLDVFDVFGHVESENIGVFVVVPETDC